jgi:hypothetical protein
VTERFIWFWPRFRDDYALVGDLLCTRSCSFMNPSGVAAILALGSIPVSVLLARWQMRTALRQAEASHRSALEVAEANHRSASEVAEGHVRWSGVSTATR